MDRTLFLKSLATHARVFLFLVITVFVAYHPLLDLPLWNANDFEVLQDACILSQSPGDMFRHLGFYFSQPLLQVFFLTEYQAFGTDPTGYFAVNLLLHALNSFIVYMLVNMLFPKRHMAHLAAFLFALAVGNYGKIFMTIYMLEYLLLATLHLLILYLFIRNDFRRGGALRSPFFLLGLLLFLFTGLTKASIFALVGCLIAYKAFFRTERRWRSLLTPDLLVILTVSVLYYSAQHQWGFKSLTVFSREHPLGLFTLLSIKNLFRYLILMFFPVQTSGMIDTIPGWIQWVLQGRLYIRALLVLSIVSYSFFGFVFGGRAVRFFIAWTYITVLPFTGHSATGAWLNLNHLYLTSLGFCVILAAGTVGTSDLLVRAGWKRFAPYVISLLFVALSLGLASRFITRNRVLLRTPEVQQMQEELARVCNTSSSDGDLAD